MGAESVIFSLGSRGAIARTSDERLEAIPPRIEAVCPIGAGDALAAAFAWARDRGKDLASSDGLRWGLGRYRLGGSAGYQLRDTGADARHLQACGCARPRLKQLGRYFGVAA